MHSSVTKRKSALTRRPTVGDCEISVFNHCLEYTGLFITHVSHSRLWFNVHQILTFATLVSLLFQRQFVFHLIFFSCVLYYIKLHYITLSYYMVYASLLSLLQLFFCLHVRLVYAIKYYLLTYLLFVM